MILVREVFRLKFGKAKEALALIPEGVALAARGGVKTNRVLTDVTGPYYTLVLEGTHASLAEFERSLQGELGAAEWAAWYERFKPLVESGRREIYRIIEL